MVKGNREIHGEKTDEKETSSYISKIPANKIKTSCSDEENGGNR